MSQQPSRPWFRLVSMARPPQPSSRPPAPAPAQPQPFRPQTPMTQPGQAPPRAPPILPTVTPRTSAPTSPILLTVTPRTSAASSPIPPTTPAPVSSSVAPPPASETAPPSPPKATSPPKPSLATLTSPATQSPKSPEKTAEIQPTPSTIRSPTTTSAQPPPISSKPTSPITKTSSPGQKASSQIAVTRPEVTYSSPKAKPSAPPPSPLKTSPAFKTVPSSPVPPQPSPVPIAAPIPTTVTARVTSPVASPKINKPWVETPPQSTKVKLLSHPPSPLTLPPAQIKAGSDLEPIPAEVEQKKVLLQETEEKSKGPPKNSNGYMIRPHSEIHNNNINTGQPRKDKGVVHTHKKHSDSEEFGARVVTLAGENKGAIMELSPSRKKIGFGAWSINGGHKLKSDSEEGSYRMKDEKDKEAPTETAPMDAFINCNVQGVNNSILYNCSCNHNDPGVHLAVSRKRNGGRGLHH